MLLAACCPHLAGWAIRKGPGAHGSSGRPQVPLDMKLEGLGATHEQLLDYSAFPPMRRHRESVALAQLQARPPPRRNRVACW